MNRLGDVVGVRLRIRCEPCSREGFYRLVRLVAEHGADSSLDTIRERLTLGCRWRRPAGMRQPGKYEPKCQARLILPKAIIASGGDSFANATAVFRIDVWLDDDSGIDREILLCTDLSLARRWFEDVATKYPGKLITLRQRAQVLMSTERRLPYGTGGW